MPAASPLLLSADGQLNVATTSSDGKFILFMEWEGIESLAEECSGGGLMDKAAARKVVLYTNTKAVTLGKILSHRPPSQVFCTKLLITLIHEGLSPTS